MKKKQYSLIGAASGWGAQIRGNEDGPSALRTFHLAEKLARRHIDVRWQEIVFSKEKGSQNPTLDPLVTLPHIIEHNENVCAAMHKCVEDGNFPIGIGGDQSTAVGIWSGAITALDRAQNFGLLWLDAHMDAHTPETTSSQAIHGMPLACLLGCGMPELVNMGRPGAKLNPEHLVLVGIRSFEEGEAALLRRLGVRIFMMEEVKQKGIDAVLAEALALISAKTDKFGVSVDLDAFDPTEAPGVGSPEIDGLQAESTLPALANVAQHPGFAALEISEYNPHRDQNFKTAELVLNLCSAICGE